MDWQIQLTRKISSQSTLSVCIILRFQLRQVLPSLSKRSWPSGRHFWWWLPGQFCPQSRFLVNLILDPQTLASLSSLPRRYSVVVITRDSDLACSRNSGSIPDSALGFPKTSFCCFEVRIFLRIVPREPTGNPFWEWLTICSKVCSKTLGIMSDRGQVRIDTTEHWHSELFAR